MREEEAAGLKTSAEICIDKVHGIPGNAKGVAAPKKQILAVEKLEIEISQEKKRTAEAEERSTVLSEKVASQEQELNALKDQMNTVMEEVARLARLQAGETVSGCPKYFCYMYFVMLTIFLFMEFFICIYLRFL